MSAMDPIYLDPGIIQVYFGFVVAMLVMAATMVIAGLIYAWVEGRARSE
jgi:preprotein translocase subunit Sec61beta